MQVQASSNRRESHAEASEACNCSKKDIHTPENAQYVCAEPNNNTYQIQQPRRWFEIWANAKQKQENLQKEQTNIKTTRNRLFVEMNTQERGICLKEMNILTTVDTIW